jgi:hypothetical protein
MCVIHRGDRDGVTDRRPARFAGDSQRTVTALATGGDRKRIRSLAEQAVETYSSDPGSEDELREAREWLHGLEGVAARGPPLGAPRGVRRARDLLRSAA